MANLILLFAAILSTVHFFSDWFSERVKKFHTQITSFSAGIFIAYIILQLLPEVFKGEKIIGANIFLLMLFGFVLFHVLEKYLYQHVIARKNLSKDLAELHTIGFFFDQFIIGMLLFFSFNVKDVLVGSIIFLPLLLHAISSSLSLSHIHEHFNKNLLLSIFLSAAPFAGALFVFFLNPLSSSYHAIFSFVVGTLLYVVIRDTIPEGKKGNIKFFVAGVLASVLIIFSVSQFATLGLFTLSLG